MQNEQLDVASGCERVEELLLTIEDYRSDESFQRFYEQALCMCKSLDLEESSGEQFRRKRTRPSRFDDDPDTATTFLTAQYFKTQFYFAVKF